MEVTMASMWQAIVVLSPVHSTILLGTSVLGQESFQDRACRMQTALIASGGVQWNLKLHSEAAKLSENRPVKAAVVLEASA